MREQTSDLLRASSEALWVSCCFQWDHEDGCHWETFDIFAYGGLVGNPILTAEICFAPLPTSTK